MAPLEPRSGVYASTGATGKELKPGDETWGDFFSAENIAPRPLAREKGSLWAGDDGADDCVPPLRNCFFQYSSRYSEAICHFIPLPGSSVRRGTFWNALFRDRLCRMEFYIVSTCIFTNGR